MEKPEVSDSIMMMHGSKMGSMGSRLPAPHHLKKFKLNKFNS